MCLFDFKRCRDRSSKLCVRFSKESSTESSFWVKTCTWLTQPHASRSNAVAARSKTQIDWILFWVLVFRLFIGTWKPFAAQNINYFDNRSVNDNNYFFCWRHPIQTRKNSFSCVVSFSKKSEHKLALLMVCIAIIYCVRTNFTASGEHTNDSRFCWLLTMFYAFIAIFSVSTPLLLLFLLLCWERNTLQKTMMIRSNGNTNSTQSRTNKILWAHLKKAIICMAMMSLTETTTQTNKNKWHSIWPDFIRSHVFNIWAWT